MNNKSSSNNKNKINIKKMAKWKKILIGIGIFVVVIVGLDFLRITYFPTDIEQFNKSVREFEQGLKDYYKSDIYGGKTPEETYNLFISALENQNIELASKYFFISEWNEKELEFKEKKEKGELEKYISDLPKWEDMEEVEREDGVKEYIHTIFVEASIEYFPDGKGGTIKTEFPAGNYANFNIIFQFNDVNNLWKISDGI